MPQKRPDPELEEAIDKIADHLTVPRELWRAMVQQESGGDPSALSPKGARGMFQIMPATARNIKKPNGQTINPDDPLDAAYGGLKILSDNYKKFKPLAKNDRHAWAMSIAGYHGSPANVLKDVKRGGVGIPDQDDGYINTQDHVYKIMKRAPSVGVNAVPSAPVESIGTTQVDEQPQSAPAIAAQRRIEQSRKVQQRQQTQAKVAEARRVMGGQVAEAGLGPQFPRGTTTGIATSRNGQLVGRQRTPQVSRADMMRVEERPQPSTGTYDNIDPRLAKGEQPSDPTAYAKAQELIGRTEPQREVGGIRAGATAMGPREQGIIEQIGEAVDPYLRLDRPAGIKTDPIRGAASLGLLDLRREISPEEKLIDPDAEAKAETAYQVGSFAPAVAPYVGAGKLVSKIPALNAATREAHIARSALTFGGVDLGRELARSAQTGEPLNPQEIAISTAIGGGIGGIAGVNPSLKRQIVAFITPGVVADVARGTDAETAVSNAFTNLLFGLHSGTAPKPLQAREVRQALEQRVRGEGREAETVREVSTPIEPTREVAQPALDQPPRTASVGRRTSELGVTNEPPTKIAPQPPVQARIEDAGRSAGEARIGSSEGGGRDRAPSTVPQPDVGEANQPQGVRHVDLQPRRVRGEGKGRFKPETKAQAEERRQQVNPVQGEGEPYPNPKTTGQQDANRWHKLLADGKVTVDDMRAAVANYDPAMVPETVAWLKQAIAKTEAVPPPAQPETAAAKAAPAEAAPTTTTLDGKSYTRGTDGEWRRDSDGKRVAGITKDRLNEISAQPTKPETLPAGIESTRQPSSASAVPTATKPQSQGGAQPAQAETTLSPAAPDLTHWSKKELTAYDRKLRKQQDAVKGNDAEWTRIQRERDRVIDRYNQNLPPIEPKAQPLEFKPVEDRFVDRPIGDYQKHPKLWERSYSDADNRERMAQFTAKDGKTYIVRHGINSKKFKVYDEKLNQVAEAVFDTGQLYTAGPKYFSGFAGSESIKVDPQHRRKGIATALTDFAERQYKAPYRPNAHGALSTEMQGFVRNRQGAAKSAPSPAREAAPKAATPELQKYADQAAAVRQKLSPGLTKVEQAAIERKAARLEAKARGEELRRSGADPYELVDDIIIRGGELIREGKTAFDEWSRKMREEFGKDADPHLRKAWKSLRDDVDIANLPEVEVKPSKLAQGVEAKAIEAKLTEGFRDLPEYEVVKVADQAEKAANLLKTDPAKATRIAMGKEIPDGDLLPESVFTAVENAALKSGDVNLLMELASSSSLSLEATGMGQRIRMLGERNPNSPVTAIKQVQEAREAKVERVYGSRKKAVDKIKSEIQVAVKRAAPKVKDWESFLDSIRC